jgi:hypothetical protein
MCEELAKCPKNNLIQIWDEMNTLAEQWGLYKIGGGSFDRSIFNNIYNGEEELQLQTKKYHLTCSQPRLSIFGCIHPHKVSY